METVNQETKNAAENTVQTFTQQDVDRIVSERLAREKAKYEDYDTLKEKAQLYDAAEEASKTELQKAQDKAEKLQKLLDERNHEDAVRNVREKVAKETGVPAELLTGETEEECKEWADKLKEYRTPSTYPNVRDAGEPRHKVGGKTARDQFADWFNESY